MEEAPVVGDDSLEEGRIISDVEELAAQQAAAINHSIHMNEAQADDAVRSSSSVNEPEQPEQGDGEENVGNDPSPSAFVGVPPPWSAGSTTMHAPPLLYHPPPVHFLQQQHPANSSNSASAQIMYYEARMRDHAVAYASAAAGAAWAAAQVASQAAEYVAQTQQTNGSGGRVVPPFLTLPHHNQLDQNQQHQYPHHHPPQQLGDNVAYPHGGHWPQNRSWEYLSFAEQQQFLGGQLPVASATLGPQQPSTAPFNNDSMQAQQAMGNYRNRAGSFQSQQQRSPQQGRPIDDSGHRRKRQQRQPPEHDSGIPREVAPHLSNATTSMHHQNDDQQYHNNNSQAAQQNYGSPHHHQSYHQQQQPQQQPRGKVRRRFLRSDNDSNSSSGSSFMTSGRGSSNHSSKRRGYNSHNKKKKPRPDESLLGKTGVSALYEWCSKKQQRFHHSSNHNNNIVPTVPTFTLQQPLSSEEFDCTVYLGDDKNGGVLKEWGKGRGRNKNAAKQEAARRALQALLPGVVFDEETGILVTLPPTTTTAVNADTVGNHRNHHHRTSASNLDDLAPNLAKQLAIGHQGDSTPLDAANRSGTTKSKQQTSKQSSSSQQQQQPKRSLGVYPDASTTSEDERSESSAYYASRGASVCSQLLHAIVQIDSARIPEVPAFSYVVNPLPQPLVNNATTSSSSCSAVGTSSSGTAAASSASNSNNKTNVSSSKRSIATVVNSMTRGSFTCTARLKVVSSVVARVDNGDYKDDNDAGEENKTEETLEAAGVGGTKREARHVASAKLLALLFPECSDMVQVKVAAEAMRERYAASKALKQQAAANSSREEAGESNKRPCVERPLFAFALATDPPLARSMEEELGLVLDMPGCRKSSGDSEDDLIMSVNAVALSENTTSLDDRSRASAFRQLSRQKQLDALVESVLQVVNDRDEEGRSLPEELTPDDVGLFQLRRAEPEDLHRIKKLFDGPSDQDPFSQRYLSKRDSPKFGPAPFLLEATPSYPGEAENPSIHGQDDTSSELISRLWSSSSIVLLLCRAIAAYEDPPLGCAVLTLGFSMEEGRILRLAQIASEPHLPQERFVECLQKFAKHMKCGFEDKANNTKVAESGIRLPTEDLVAIVKSHVINDEKPPAVLTTKTRGLPDTFKKATSSMSQLQSVQEESEVSDDSGAAIEKRAAAKRVSKPSKRSRFQ